MKSLSLQSLILGPRLARELRKESIQKQNPPVSHERLLEAQSLREAQNHPFLNLQESLPNNQSKKIKLQIKQKKLQSPVRPQSLQQKQPPSNKYLLDRASSLSQQLPSLVNQKTKGITEFVLTSVAPSQLALFNGIEDASVILKDTLGEDPRLGAFSLTAEKYINFGIKAKLASEITKLLNLSDIEKDLFMLQVVSKDFSVDMTSEAINAMLTKIAKKGTNSNGQSS